VLVESLLAATAGGAGAAVALLAALVARAAGGHAPGRAAVAVVLGAALVLELAWSFGGRPAPWSVRRQVPQVWSRLFGPATVAVLYGLRLGIGPATILATWWWWAATVVSVPAGPGPAALVGATFGVTRVVVMHVAVARLRAPAPARARPGAAATAAAVAAGSPMSARLGRVRRLERPVGRLGLVVVAAALVAVAAACSGSDRPTLTATTIDDGPGAGATTSIPPSPAIVADPAPAAATAAPPATAAAAPAAGTDTAAETAPEARVPLDDLLLGDEVTAALPGAAAVLDGAAGSGPLDLAAAAAAEQDQQAERALLETRRFVRGHERTWTAADPSGPRAYALVYEFADTGGAAAYLVDGREHLAARNASLWTVAGLDGATGFTQSDGGFTAQGVAFSRGPWFFLVVANGPGVDAGVVSSLAAAQSDRAAGLGA
jgi:hypothetical protein